MVKILEHGSYSVADSAETQIHVCKYCQLKLKVRFVMEKHQLMCHQAPAPTDNGITEPENPLLLSNEETRKTWTCQVCSKVVKYKYSLERHMKSQHPDIEPDDPRYDALFSQSAPGADEGRRPGRPFKRRKLDPEASADSSDHHGTTSMETSDLPAAQDAHALDLAIPRPTNPAFDFSFVPGPGFGNHIPTPSQSSLRRI